MLDPDLAARVADLEAAGKCHGDAVGIAQWERDEQVACWAALVAYVQDVHAPWDNLTEAQWVAADRLTNALNQEGAALDGEQYILFCALASSLGLIDSPDLDEDGWATAERMLAEYAAKVDP